jgi:N-acetylmuramoyl-L-alanine amidase/Secretion system C-terminal sorting domain
LIENGEGYFKNNLVTLATKAKMSSDQLKQSTEAQIMAMAQCMQGWIEQHTVNSITDLAAFYKAYSEIPDNTTIDAFAKDQLLYDIYLALTRGFESNGIVVPATAMDYHLWFDENTYSLVSGDRITITDNSISNGNAVYRNNINNGSLAVTSTDYPPALWVASPNYSSRNATAITAVAVHTTQGAYSGTISWFQNTASNVSAHYVIRSSDGQVTQMVLEANKAWHIGSENPYTIGLEHEGFVAQTGWYTTAMYNSSAALVRDICTDNNINKTTCYNGASSSGTNLLSSAIKIKGHQHFPNQTHTDPGINWDWPLYYSLINPAPACAAPTTLNESYIGTAFANLNWTAVSGATGYIVSWKASTATVWNSATITNNYYTIAGLGAASSYDWKVATQCSAGTGAASVTQTFTTKASCYDAYENNNVYTAPAIYPSLNGGYVYGKICGSGDVDFFKITTTATSNINFTLATLPKNYDIETYTSTGTYLQGAYTTGTGSETLVLKSKPAGTYLFRIYGASAADNDAINDYRLSISTSAPTARIDDASAMEQLILGIQPNPAKDRAVISFTSTNTERVQIRIKDVQGTTRIQQTTNGTGGVQQITINTEALPNGIYVVQISNSKSLLLSKQLVINK